MNIETTRYILLVDDERLVLAMLKRGLVTAGYRVNTAESVDEAETLLASGERPDLIILDMNMPNRNGLELAERLRALDNIPFVLLTANNNGNVVKQASEYGALSYIVKPVDVRQLVPAIEAALARAEELRALRKNGHQLQTALNAERDISVAIGITMAQRHLSRHDAGGLLRKTARSKRQKLAELASDVVHACEMLNL